LNENLKSLVNIFLGYFHFSSDPISLPHCKWSN